MLIDENENGTVVLDKDYKFDPATDDPNGINISKPVTIDANGKTLDANGALIDLTGLLAAQLRIQNF